MNQKVVLKREMIVNGKAFLGLNALMIFVIFIYPRIMNQPPPIIEPMLFEGFIIIAIDVAFFIGIAVKVLFYRRKKI
ncbi:hypothetical protein IMZ31_22575 (plasmid) [Pontibacillus sp. ALD_SL1]|uniref:hypothetical protein n=1 Tax=Pontibacillus sp. ALD_SL1 TaxID=2777185 RepID=UPI001A9652F8|nr:hypothetical protein [Pontibacillus sp. ALD_SL1]QST02242.1 hypothetical protein IMZ31_22575 [Pontibacillus sp. ALD_SL1]